MNRILSIEKLDRYGRAAESAGEESSGYTSAGSRGRFARVRVTPEEGPGGLRISWDLRRGENCPMKYTPKSCSLFGHPACSAAGLFWEAGTIRRPACRRNCRRRDFRR